MIYIMLRTNNQKANKNRPWRNTAEIIARRILSKDASARRVLPQRASLKIEIYLDGPMATVL